MPTDDKSMSLADAANVLGVMSVMARGLPPVGAAAFAIFSAMIIVTQISPWTVAERPACRR